MTEISGKAYHPHLFADRGMAVPPFNLASLLEQTALGNEDAVWISDRDTALTYGEAAHLAGRMAATLIAAGVEPDDRVAVIIPNHPAFLIAIWGVWQAGAIASAMHPAYAEPTLAAQIEDCAPRCLITLETPELHERADRLAHGRGITVLTLPATGALEQAALANEAAHPRYAHVDSLALLQYTGGTTGGVKAAMLTHRSLSHNLAQVVGELPDLLVGDERLLAVAPFAHITGFQLLCLSLYLKARLVLESRFEADRTAQLCLEQRISFFACVPTLLEGLNRSPVAQSGVWNALKYVIAGGAPLPAAIRDRFEAMTGCRVLGGYGLSEASPGILIGAAAAGVPPESVGPPVAGTRLSISAADDPDRYLPLGETGEIRVAGPQLMDGYWRKPDETATALHAGMLRTGDLGHIAADGRVHVSGRLKDLIISSGYNVYPARIEDAIFTHHAVADVAVIGIHDDYRGESVKAVIVLKPDHAMTLEDLQQWLKPRLSPMEMPRHLELREALPKSPAGKTLKIKLRESAPA